MAEARRKGVRGYDPAMGLEERTLDSVGERCEECGAKLTSQELQVAMERGGPTLCAIHATETVALDDPGLDEPAA